MSYETDDVAAIIMMGGRVAEEMIFGKEKVTSGAAIRHRAGYQARPHDGDALGAFRPELGAVSYGENQDEVFLGMSVARTQNVSEATAQKIDTEIRRLVEEGHNEARKMLEAKRNDLEVLAKGLLEFETLSGDEIKDLLLGKRPVRESVIEPQTPRSSAVPPAGKSRPRPGSGDGAAGAAAAVVNRGEHSQSSWPGICPAISIFGVQLCHCCCDATAKPCRPIRRTVRGSLARPAHGQSRRALSRR